MNHIVEKSGQKMNTETMLHEVPTYEDNPIEGVYVYLCDLCGQPLRPSAKCNSDLHVGPNGGKKGKAVKSTQMARNLRRGKLIFGNNLDE